MSSYDRKVTKPAIVMLATIVIVGILIVFALTDYGGEIGLITKEEPRLAYLYCREEIKDRLHLSDYNQFDNYLDTVIDTIQPHQYRVEIWVNVLDPSNLPSHNGFSCNITAHPNGTWQISGLNIR